MPAAPPPPAHLTAADLEIAAIEKMLAISEDVELRVREQSLPVWQPQPGPQTQLFECDADEILFGGSAGGGKSSAAVALLSQRLRLRGYRALVLRRTSDDLSHLFDEARAIFHEGRPYGRFAFRPFAPTPESRWFDGNWLISKEGGRAKFGHCHNDDDYKKHIGLQWDDVIFDELPHFTLKQYTEIIARCRGTNPAIKRRRALATANPPEQDDPGATWIKARWGPWLDDSYELRDWQERDPDTGEIVRGKGLPDRFAETQGPPPDPLAIALTRSALLDLVDEATFARGQNCVGAGRVRELARDRDAVRAIVEGAATYETRLQADEDALRTACSCPQGQLRRACKHAVAVGLAWLAAHPPAVASTETRRRRLPPAASAQLLYVAMVGEGDNAVERFSTEPFTWRGAKAETRTFIASKLSDNQAMLEVNPNYVAKLRQNDPVRAQQLELGDWNVKPAPGLYFKRSWFEIVDDVPTGIAQFYRRWDLAATVPTRQNPDPDWTEGVRAAFHEDGYLYVDEIVSCREDPGGVDRFIRDTICEADGSGVLQIFPIDPGAAGKKEAVRLAQLAEREGVPAETEPERGAKSLRIRFLSSICSPKTNDRADTTHDNKPSDVPLGRVKLVRGPWNERFLRQAEAWEPKVSDEDRGHDDILDALAGLAHRYAQGDGVASVGVEVIGGGRAA